MDFTKIRLIGLTTVDLLLRGAKPSDTYILKAADGLGPPPKTVTIVKGMYQGEVVEDREIVLRVGLNANYRLGQTPGGLRDELYGLLTPDVGDNIPIQIMNGDNVVALTDGYVSKIEIVPFSQDPEVQITIPCGGPYFRAPEALTLVPVGKAAFTVPNSGSAPTGFAMDVIMNQALSTWTLNLPKQKMKFDYAFHVDDVLTINTSRGERELVVTRAGVTTVILDSLSSDSKWLMLRGGDNLFTTSDASFKWGSIVYTPLYWGI